MMANFINLHCQFRFGLLVILFCLGNRVVAQSDCIIQAQGVLEEIRTKLDQTDQYLLYSKVRITTKHDDPKTPNTTEVLEIITGNKQTAVANPQFTLLSDKVARVVVLPTDKLVYVYDMPPVMKDDEDAWWKYTELAFTKGKLLTCVQNSGAKGNELIAEFDVSEIDEMGGMAKLRFSLDPQRALPVAYRGVYPKGRTIRERLCEFLIYQPGRTDPRVQTSVLAQILPEGKLAPFLGGYELHDLRSKGSFATFSTAIPELK